MPQAVVEGSRGTRMTPRRQKVEQMTDGGIYSTRADENRTGSFDFAPLSCNDAVGTLGVVAVVAGGIVGLGPFECARGRALLQRRGLLATPVFD